MDEQRTQEIRARLSRATPGPWEADALEGYVVAPSGRVATVTMWRDADADLIAHAPTDLADLLAENARLTYLLGSHADGHRCTCVPLDQPSIMEPPTWEQDQLCPTHPDMDFILAERGRLLAENTRLRRIAGLATAGAAELAIARLEAENERLRAVADAACGYTDVMDGSGTVTLGEHRRQLTAAVRAYRADTTGGE